MFLLRTRGPRLTFQTTFPQSHSKSPTHLCYAMASGKLPPLQTKKYPSSSSSAFSALITRLSFGPFFVLAFFFVGLSSSASSSSPPFSSIAAFFRPRLPVEDGVEVVFLVIGEDDPGLGVSTEHEKEVSSGSRSGKMRGGGWGYHWSLSFPRSRLHIRF